MGFLMFSMASDPLNAVQSESEMGTRAAGIQLKSAEVLMDWRTDEVPFPCLNQESYSSSSW